MRTEWVQLDPVGSSIESVDLETHSHSTQPFTDVHTQEVVGSDTSSWITSIRRPHRGVSPSSFSSFITLSISTTSPPTLGLTQPDTNHLTVTLFPAVSQNTILIHVIYLIFCYKTCTGCLEQQQKYNIQFYMQFVCIINSSIHLLNPLGSLLPCD